MLHKEQLFEIDKSKRLGTMRIDWRNGVLANQWNVTDLLIELHNKKEIDLKVIQDELNYIQFELLDTINKVISYTSGYGYEYETIVYYKTELLNIAIKLIPLLDTYSYIYVYNK